MTSKPVDTAIVMIVGPCIDDTDFKSLEEAIAYNAAGMDISLIVEKTDGTTAVTAITLTTGGTSDWTHKDGGYYEVEITAAQNAEEGIAFLRGLCTGVLPFESAHYDIVKANIYDSLIKGTDKLQVLADGMSTAMKAEVNAEVADVSRVDTVSEPAQGAPPASPTPEEMLKYLYFMMRNKTETTATEKAIYDNAGTTKLMKETLSDDTLTFTESEYVSG